MATITFVSSNSEAFVKLRNTLPIKHYTGKHTLSTLTPRSPEHLESVTTDVLVLANVPKAHAVPVIERLAKRCKIVWQLDDNFWDMPATNAYRDNITPQIPDLNHCLRQAHQIWTATPELAGVVKEQLGIEATVVPNLIDMDDYSYRERTNQHILWAGGVTHWQDLALIQDLPEQHTDKGFIFFGDLPENCRMYSIVAHKRELLISCKHRNTLYIQPQHLPQYLDTMRQLEVSYGLCPVTDHPFNHCKSLLKFMEYAAMGLTVIASNFKPYSTYIVNGVTGYLTDDWGNVELNPQSTGKAAYEYVKDQHSWQSQAKVWTDLLDLL